MMTASGVSFTNIQAPKCHQKILREKKKNGSQPSLNPNRASYPGPATMTSSDLAMSSSSTSSSGERLNGTDGKEFNRLNSALCIYYIDVS